MGKFAMTDATQRTPTSSSSNGKHSDSNPQPKVQRTPPQRKNSGAETPTSGSTAAKKRRKVNHACIYCRRSHMTCDLERPCTRCIKRSIGHLCHDEPRDKKKPDVNGGTPESNSKTSLGNSNNLANGLNLSMSPPEHVSTASLVQPTPLHTAHAGVIGSNNNVGMVVQDWMYNPHAPLGQNMHTLHPGYMFNTSEVSNEYSLLNDFVSNSMIDDTIFNSNDEQSTTVLNSPFTNSSMAFSSQQLGPNQMPPPATLEKEIVRPLSAFPTIDKIKAEQFSLIAADPAGTDAPEERLKKLLQAKYDAGLLRPFDYVKGYDRMYKYIKAHLKRESISIISKQIEQFRPIFRERVSGLRDVELVLVEIELEKLLMQYDRVFASMAIPACCWRRTGEIERGNKEMSELVNIPMDRFRDKKIAIHDIFAERGLVKYWKEFGKIAFVESQKAMLSSVILKHIRQDGQQEEIECCFSFTIVRDKHNIPFLVVGNFLKIEHDNS